MFRRIAACILALALCLGLTATAGAAVTTPEAKAKNLYSMGLFKGKGTHADGSPDFALGDSATRNEAATMLIRLLGKEAKATAQYQAGAFVCPFKDVPNWAKANVAWLYENNYTNGTSAALYSGSDTITAQQFAAFLLRSLGYSETTGDFAYANALSFAVQKGVLTAGQSAQYQALFLRDGMVEMCYNALALPMKNSERTLKEKLTNDGVFSGKNTAALAGTSAVSLSLKYSGGGSDSEWYVQEGTASAPAITDLNGDGKKEILCNSRAIFCLDAATGKTIWRFNAGGDRAKAAADGAVGKPVGDIKVLDIDGDGVLEFVTLHTNYGISPSKSTIAVYNAQGYYEPGWPITTPYPANALEISDLDRDGKCELCVGLGVGAAMAPSLYVYEPDGSLRSGWPQMCEYGVFNDTMATADLDRDGQKELVLLYDAEMTAAFRADGSKAMALGGEYAGLTWCGQSLCEDYQHELACVDYVRSHGSGRASADGLLGMFRGRTGQQLPLTREGVNCVAGTFGGIAAEDLDGNGSVELACTGMMVDGSKLMRNGVNSYEGIAKYYTAFILNTDRTRYKNTAKGFDWTEMPTDPGTILSLNSNQIPAAKLKPVVADVDRDGNKEILYAANDGKVHCWNLDGTEHGAWPYSLDTRSSSSVLTYATRPVCADVNGDGKQEVVFATYTQLGQASHRGSLYVLDCTGKVLATSVLPEKWAKSAAPKDANGCQAQPCVGDVDGDGRNEIVLHTLYTGVLVYDIA